MFLYVRIDWGMNASPSVYYLFSASCVCIPIYKMGMLIVSKQGFSGVNEMANSTCT